MPEKSNVIPLQKESQKITIYRFDIFKGVKSESGKIVKVKSIGSVFLRDGLKTYTVHLKTLLNVTFYLLTNLKKTTSNADFVILTREEAQNMNRKYFWNNVGEGILLEGENHGLLELTWDVFGGPFYMNLSPINVTEMIEDQGTASVA